MRGFSLRGAAGVLGLALCCGACSTSRWEREPGRTVAPEEPARARHWRQLGPLSGLVTSSHVVFRWLPEVSATVEISGTRDFHTVAWAQAGRGEAAIGQLTEGSWFWRVRGAAAITSETWRLRVLPRTERPMRQSLVNGSDTDGNGLSDVLIHRRLFLGGAPAAKTVGLQPRRSKRELGVPRALGDINGDGLDDWLGSSEAPVILFGSTFGRGVLPSGGEWPRRRRTVVRASDVDGDGYGDVLVDGSLFRGGADGLARDPAVVLGGGRAWGAGGDVNGDGYADVAVITEGGRLGLYLGSAVGVYARPLWLRNVGATDAEDVPIRLGDIDGDGFADIIWATHEEVLPRRLAFHVIVGSQNMSGPSDYRTLSVPVPIGSYSWDLDYHGGVVGQSARIVAIDADQYHQEILTITYARAAGFRLQPLRRVHSSTAAFRTVEAVGDVDGDGIDDVVDAFSSDGESRRRALLVRGHAGSFDVLSGPDSFQWYDHWEEPFSEAEFWSVSREDRLEDHQQGLDFLNP